MKIKLEQFVSLDRCCSTVGHKLNLKLSCFSSSLPRLPPLSHLLANTSSIFPTFLHELCSLRRSVPRRRILSKLSVACFVFLHSLIFWRTQAASSPHSSLNWVLFAEASVEDCPRRRTLLVSFPGALSKVEARAILIRSSSRRLDFIIFRSRFATDKGWGCFPLYTMSHQYHTWTLAIMPSWWKDIKTFSRCAINKAMSPIRHRETAGSNLFSFYHLELDKCVLDKPRSSRLWTFCKNQ